jgi:hypothetical protein
MTSWNIHLGRANLIPETASVATTITNFYFFVGIQNRILLFIAIMVKNVGCITFRVILKKFATTLGVRIKKTYSRLVATQ